MPHAPVPRDARRLMYPVPPCAKLLIFNLYLAATRSANPERFAAPVPAEYESPMNATVSVAGADAVADAVTDGEADGGADGVTVGFWAFCTT